MCSKLKGTLRSSGHPQLFRLAMTKVSSRICSTASKLKAVPCSFSVPLPNSALLLMMKLVVKISSSDFCKRLFKLQHQYSVRQNENAENVFRCVLPNQTEYNMHAYKLFPVVNSTRVPP